MTHRNKHCLVVEEGIEAYKEALRLKPDMAKTHYNLGLAYAKKGRFREAVQSYNKALELRPDPHPDNANVRRALERARAASGL